MGAWRRSDPDRGPWSAPPPDGAPLITSGPALIDRAKGCLLAGALGDALGAPVEFLSRVEILAKYPTGPGIAELDHAYGRIGAITDDTQMTLFTAEGLIRGYLRAELRGIGHPPGVVAYAYQRWLSTQGGPTADFAIDPKHRGWLVCVPELRSRRAPGNTCIRALRQWDGEPAKNDSKGCGTVMRSAPFGFFECAWDYAWECAAITHGHLEAKVAAGIMSVAIQNLLLGRSLADSLLGACELDRDESRSSRLVRRAVDLARADNPPDADIFDLGLGWVAEEALAIGAYCALRAGDDPRRGLRMAVNHDGDSDSTGSICGNLMGAAHGTSILPESWLDRLEATAVIEQVAEDMVAVQRLDDFVNPAIRDAFVDQFFIRYPGC